MQKRAAPISTLEVALEISSSRQYLASKSLDEVADFMAGVTFNFCYWKNDTPVGVVSGSSRFPKRAIPAVNESYLYVLLG